MRLQEIFDSLKSSEFSQLSIGGAGPGVIDETNYSAAVGFVNLGLMALFRRFALKTGSLDLQLHEAIDDYRLVLDCAVSATRSKQPVRYILDSAMAPFEDDVIKVERVLDAMGEDLPLNKENDPWSVVTPSSTRLKVPSLVPRQVLSVVYRAHHPKLSVGMGYFDPARVEVDLPDTHLEALLYFIAARAHTPMGAGAGEGAAAMGYLARYEAVCSELEGKGLQVDKSYTPDRLRANGWV